MHLVEIHLENFKSFGRKTILPFEPGFTAITGPNGSGKSNIGDAILFVLGPKSSKALRAGKLTDLIYNGGNNRKPASYCKVTLVFDNKDRIIPIDDDVVRLTRLVKISPADKEQYYSYFYVNGRSSNLAEFDTLLAHARISAEGYNLVQQGDITRIVSMSKIDRRRILDGIAGIAQYDDDIELANKKKAAVDEKMTNINSVLSEINKRIKTLDKDRDDAVRYKKLRDEGEVIQAKIAYKKKDEVEAEAARAGKQILEFQGEQEQLGKQIAAMKKEHIAMSQQLDDFDGQIAQLRGSEANKITEELDEVKMSYFKGVDQIDKSRIAIKNLKEEQAHLVAEVRKLAKERTDVGKSQAALSKDLAALEGSRKGVADELKAIEELVTSTDSKAFSIQREVVQAQKALQDKEEERHRLLLEQDRLTERSERLTVEIAAIEQSVKQHEFEVADLEHALKELHKGEGSASKSSKDVRAKVAAKRTQLQGSTTEAEELESRITFLRRDYEALKAESHATAAASSGYTRAVNAILEQRDTSHIKGIVGTIAEIGTVDKHYEGALGVAGGTRLQSVVVEDDEVAARCIGFLKDEGLGRVTFLPLNKMIGARPSGKALMAVRDKGAIGFATDLVKFEERYAAAFWYVFGDTIVVKDLTTARKLMGGVRLVTLGGEITEKAGAMIGGSAPTGTVGFGPDSSRKELDRIGKELAKVVDAADKRRDLIATLRKELEGLESELSSSGVSNVEVEGKIRDYEFKCKEHLRLRDEQRKLRDERAKERDQVSQSLDKGKRAIAEAEQEHAALAKAAEAKRAVLTKATPKELQKRMKELHGAMAGGADSGRELQLKIAELEAQARFLDQTINEREARQKAIATGITEQELLLNSSKEDARTFDAKMRSLKDVAAKSSTTWNKLQEDRNALFEKRTGLTAKVDKASDTLQIKDDLILQTKDKQRILEEELHRCVEALEAVGKQDFGTSRLPPVAELTENLRVLEKQMKAMEPVNMKALEDFEGEVSRRAEMTQETEHLMAQRKELDLLVEELDGKKTTGLLKVFEAININFQRIFAQLSIHGEAELQLENPKKPFEGGLNIKARPKDKKVLRLESLSGGEKSLTALAFIFAIQQYQPSPFYLLDEVDMFLDGVNAQLVAENVKANSTTAQFVMVSLRHATLKQADHIYGVTMQSNGITDVVGHVNLSDVGKEGHITRGAGRSITKQTSVNEVAAAVNEG